MNRSELKNNKFSNLSRLQIIGWGFCVVGALIVFRLFYVQVIQHSKYSKLAENEQTKKFEIPAKRGEILAKDGSELVPLVLNEPAYTIYADPSAVANVEKTANQLTPLISRDKNELIKLLSLRKTSYVSLERQASTEQANKIKGLKLKGIGLTEISKRVYPEGDLAAHVLGFVNNDGQGQYGIEQAMNKRIGGTKGQLNGATDVRGIPIATEGSVVKQPKNGNDIILTIDRSIQTQAEFFLKKGLDNAKSTSGSILVMDPQTGRVVALANAPTFNPEDYSKQKDASVFQNTAITSAYEPGSVVKVFTMSAALNEGVITPETTYLDYSKRIIDGYTIKNTGPVVTKQRSMTEVITKSANTGTIFALEQLGGGDINSKAKETLHGYFTDRFRFGSVTGIEQTGESAGFVLKAQNAPDVNYANMSFGQGVSMSMIQLATGLSAIANSGKYYKPTLIDSYRNEKGIEKKNKPVVVAENIIKDKTADQVKAMMETVVTQGTARSAARAGYRIGAKTGTAEVAKSDGGYYDDREIGSVFGITPLESPRYVIIVRVDNPKIAGAVGSAAAVPIFAEMNNWLIDYYGILPTE